MATHSNFLPGKFLGHRSLAGYSLGGHKELVVTEQLTFGLSGLLSVLILCPFMLLQMALFHSFLWLSSIPLCKYTTFF